MSMDFQIKTNFPDADFWLQMKGSKKTVGTPKDMYDDDATRRNTASHYDIGIKVPEGVDKKHFWNWLWHLYNNNYWNIHSYGTLNLQHIRIRDVRDKLNEYEPNINMGSQLDKDKVNEVYDSWLKQSNLLVRLMLSTPELRNRGKKLKEFLERLL